MSEEKVNDVVKFKHLLEYFVTHLEYCQNGDANGRGYREYIEPYGSDFARTSQNSNFDKVQNQISKWSNLNGTRISLRVNAATQERYCNDGCFYNWEHTPLKIVARWNENRIIKLVLSVWNGYSNKNSVIKSFENNNFLKQGVMTDKIKFEIAESVDTLGLFDGADEVSESLKNFFEKYKIMLNVFKEEKKNEIRDLLLNNHNIILHGAPGTGKTFLAKQIAKDLIFTKEEHDLIDQKESEVAESDHEKYENLKKQFSERCGFVQFHQSYDYTDFVEGLRPIKNGTEIGFELRSGVFKDFCEKALASKEPYIFIIDEINRGEMSKIFGELFYSIDPGYRVKNEDLENGKIPFAIQTQYSNLQEEPNKFDEKLKIENKEENKGKYGHFFVPENVYIIGTMNDIDRSVESMDFAMRRRFAFEEISANERVEMLQELSNSEWIDSSKKKMESLNKAIEGVDGLSSAYHIGPAYFLKLKNYEGNFDSLWEYHIEGVVKEYLRGMDNAKDSLKNLAEAYGYSNLEKYKENSSH